MNKLISIKRMYLSGIEITGFAADSSAVTIPSIKKVTSKQGADGLILFGRTGVRGGPVKIKLMADSPSVKMLQSLMDAFDLGADILLEGYVEYTNGVKVALIDGMITDYPPGYTVGNDVAANMEYEITFGLITTNMSLLKNN